MVVGTSYFHFSLSVSLFVLGGRIQQRTASETSSKRVCTQCSLVFHVLLTTRLYLGKKTKNLVAPMPFKRKEVTRKQDGRSLAAQKGQTVEARHKLKRKPYKNLG
jgi:hypothetical protein